MAEVYEKSGDLQATEDFFAKTIKKFKTSKKVWLAYLCFRIRKGDVEGTKSLLARSMQSLSKHKHVEVISKVALTEFEIGSPERGRVLFEELLNSFPKRTDLWHVYVDREVKSGNKAEARQLFQRLTAAKFSAQNMKTVFKKYLAFEMANGSVDQQEAVKLKARDYVNSVI